MALSHPSKNIFPGLVSYVQVYQTVTKRQERLSGWPTLPRTRKERKNWIL